MKIINPPGRPTLIRAPFAALALLRIFLAMLVALSILALPTVPAFAADGELALLPSPYGGSLTVEEQKASAAARPALADANWNHEVCVIAYSYESTPGDIVAVRTSFEAREVPDLQATLRAQGAPEAEIQNIVDEARAELEAKIAEVERKAVRHLANIPKCKGQFFRPALESICSGNSSGNRFCAQLDGALLPGVELLEDKLEFAHGLSWNKVGELFTRGAKFAPAPWDVAPARALKPSAYPMTKSADGAYIFEPADGPALRFHPQMFSEDSDLALFDQMTKAREADLEAVSKAGIAYIATVNNAVIGNSDEEFPFGTGQWAFSIGVDRFPKYQVGHEVSVLAGNIERETGMVTDLGEYYQLPSLHFQAQIYDILVQSDFARFVVEKVGGETVALTDTDPDVADVAWFQSPPENGPFFGSSYASYRVHALMTPSPEDLKTILDPQAAFLVASFEMLLEDGSIDVVTLRTPLTGISEAWVRMNRDHLETRNLIRQTAKDWDGRIADAKAERAGLVQERAIARQAMAVATEKEARAYIAANPFERGCGRLPIGAVGGDADSVNRQAGRIMECDRHWVARMRVVKDKLGSLRSRYSSLGGTDSFIADEIHRWDGALAQRNADLEQYNAAINAHNQGAMRSTANGQSRRAPSAVARRRQSYDRRNHQGGDGHDYAREFFENQRRPQRSMFRDVTIPPKPNGYIGTGYW